MINERESGILNILVEYYIEKGEPVGSTYISSVYREKGKTLSPATIRNVFKEMEKKGLITKTHLSSGRVPTKKGLSLYLESLVESFKRLKVETYKTEKVLFEKRLDVRTNLEMLADFLKDETGVASILVLPDFYTMKIKRINFVKLSNKKVLVVVVSANNLFRETIIDLPFEVDYNDLITASNYINLNFSGLTLFEIKKRLLNSIESGLTQLNNAVSKVIKVAYDNLDNLYAGKEDGLIIKGLYNLFDGEFLKHAELLKQLLKSFEKKRSIYELISKLIDKELAVSIDFPASDFSFILSTYSLAGGSKGAFGLIGPLRMNYKKNIALMRHVSRKMIEQMIIQ